MGPTVLRTGVAAGQDRGTFLSLVGPPPARSAAIAVVLVRRREVPGTPVSGSEKRQVLRVEARLCPWNAPGAIARVAAETVTA